MRKGRPTLEKNGGGVKKKSRPTQRRGGREEGDQKQFSSAKQRPLRIEMPGMRGQGVYVKNF